MSIFNKYENEIFAQRIALRTTYLPERLIGRDAEIEKVASLFAPLLNRGLPYNGFIYGKTGVGKTATVKYVLLEFERISKERHIAIKYVLVNCNQLHTTTAVLKRICNVIAPAVAIPSRGIATSEYYQVLWDVINRSEDAVIVILDEVDKLDDDSILYNISRADENLDVKYGSINVIGISNDLTYKERLDARTLSSFGERRIVFAPYNSNQLRDILEQRAKEAFKPGALNAEVIPLCAALAAQEHGDARKALMLLEYAGEIAAKRHSNKVTESDVREAQNQLESDEIIETITTLPRHQKLVLQVVIESDSKELGTNEIYDHYLAKCEREDVKPLSKTRISTFIQELDMLGLINADIMYKGRHGRKRIVRLNVPKMKIEELLAIETG